MTFKILYKIILLFFILQIIFKYKYYTDTVVSQYWDSDVNKEYAIRGNSAILKCVVPSFVGDFVKVLSWHTDQGEEFLPNNDYGIQN